MELVRPTNFTKAEADVAALADGTIAAARPAGLGIVSIGRKLSAVVELLGSIAGETAAFDVHLVHGRSAAGQSTPSWNGRLTKIGELAFTVGATALPADDPVAPGMYPASAVTWTPTAKFALMEAARGEDGTAVIDTLFHLLCMDRGNLLVLKPKAYSHASLVTNALCEPSRP